MTRPLCQSTELYAANVAGRREAAVPCPRATAALPRTRRSLVACMLATMAAVLAAGCKSDLSQQLLERELRMQEDQIYQLQDELNAKCARLERVAGENTSLRRQLGFADGDASPAPNRPTPAAGQPTFVPPPLTIPGGPTANGSPTGAPGRLPPPIAIPAAPGSGAAPASIGPPKLEGVPPVPADPLLPGAAAPAPTTSVMPVAAAVPATADVDPAARPIAAGSPAATGRQLSHDESLAEAGRITHLVVNQARSECFDGDGDGASDGLAIVIEPRDDDERLVTAAGDVILSVLDDRGSPVARWEIPSQEAVTHFRRTSRNRGLHFVLRWPGQPPQGAAVRVLVTLTAFDGTSFETNCMVAAQPRAAGGEPR